MYTAYKALPTSGKAIAKYARSIRNDIGLGNTFFFPVMVFLEHILPQAFPDMNLEIVPPQDMPFKEGETIPGQNTIRIREDVYTAACDNNGRARFTVTHEIGHFLIHTSDSIVLCRRVEGTKLPPYEDPEWQANTFAGELLAPSYLIKNLSTRQVMQLCCISEKAAEIALAKSRKLYR